MPLPHLNGATFASLRVVGVEVYDEPPDRVVGRIHTSHDS
jgi:hypothetical protein